MRTWHEYPISRGANLAAATVATSNAALLAMAAAAGLVLLLNLGVEVGLYGAADVTVDGLTRATLPTIIIVAWLVGLARAIAAGYHQVAVSRALVRAAAGGAPVEEVPHPVQADLATAPAFTGLLHLSLGSLAILGVFYPGMLWAFFSLRGSDGLIPVGIATVVLACLVGAVVWILKVARPEHAARGREIDAHWAVSIRNTLRNMIESDARKAEEQEQAEDPARDLRGLRSRATAGRVLIGAGSVALQLCILLTVLMVWVYHPDGLFGLSGPQGPIVLSEDGTPTPVPLLVWCLVLLGVGLVLVVLGALRAGVAQGAQRRALVEALGDAAAERPAREVLEAYAAPRPVLLAQWLAALGGFGLGLSLTLTLAAAGLMTGVHRGSGLAEALAPLGAWPAAMSVGLGLLLLVAVAWNTAARPRGKELRNALHRRWPVPPPRQDEDD